MPYPNEHSCRLLAPTTPHERVRRSAGEIDGKPVSTVYYIRRREGGLRADRQAVRFPKRSWTAEQAKKLCDEWGGTFEPAKEGGE